MCADTPRAHGVKPGPAAPHGPLRAPAKWRPETLGTTAPGSPRAALPLRASELGSLQRSLIKIIKKKIINRCHVGTPVLEMSLETEAAALLRRLAAGGLAASHRLSRWRFPFNGLFAADTSQSGAFAGAGRGEPAAQSARPGGGASQRSAPAIGWRRGAGDAHPSSSAREALKGAGRGARPGGQ